MNLSPINAQRARDGIDKQRPDGFPADWHNDITARGVSRNTASGHYVVKLAVAGKQFFLGTAYSQPTAALLYDYAVWKFAGKIARAMHVNFPEEFRAITQSDIDRDCPRLNDLYDKIPFISAVDETKPETELRASRLPHGKFLSPPSTAGVRDFYQTVLARFKRLRVQSTENFEHVTDWHSRLGLQKVPDVYNRIAAISELYATLSKKLLELEASMDSNHAYYKKVNYEKTSEI